MFTRNIQHELLLALKDTPILLVNGARQVGKSTLVKSLLQETHHYYTMDDPTTLSGIKEDPLGFLKGLPGPSILDEIQRVPELFLPLKKVVDENRQPGFFVLTGSANVLSLPKLADSLAGRMEIHTLWPLSQEEIQGNREDFISELFRDKMKLSPSELSQEDLIEMIVRGGYPEALSRSSHDRRKKWFSSYITTLMEKDIRELAQIEGLVELPRLLQLFAARAATLVNLTEVSRSVGIPATTLKRYLTLLEKTYLLVFVPAWSRNLNKRLVKSPKAYLNDTGLLTYLVDTDQKRLAQNKAFLGQVLENFVVMELSKHMTWSKQRCSLYHYRIHAGQEVDLVLEVPDGRVVGLEVKLSQTVTPKDFKGLESLKEDCGDHFHKGIVLYGGKEIVPFGRGKFAVPLSALWG